MTENAHRFLGLFACNLKCNFLLWQKYFTFKANFCVRMRQYMLRYCCNTTMLQYITCCDTTHRFITPCPVGNSCTRSGQISVSPCHPKRGQMTSRGSAGMPCILWDGDPIYRHYERDLLARFLVGLGNNIHCNRYYFQ